MFEISWKDKNIHKGFKENKTLEEFTFNCRLK